MLFSMNKLLQPDCVHVKSHIYFFTFAMTAMVFQEEQQQQQQQQDFPEWRLLH
jgi:hypothetical protein